MNALPYSRQLIEDDDIAAVVEVLRSDWLTTGPKVEAFEKAFAEFTGSREAVAVANGTAALHAALFALKVSPGDEVILPPMTFAATANCVVFQGATPVFADVKSDTLLIDPERIEERITSRTRAIISVDYAGQPCDYDVLAAVAQRHGLALVADACHALGAASNTRPVGSLADLNTFSLHPVKPMTTGEGGVITTDDPALADRMRRFRNHGITADHHQRARQDSWFYEIEELGYNYRITDFQCALGLSQLRKLPAWIARRRAIARRYDEAFADLPAVAPLGKRDGAAHGYHLYVVRLHLDELAATRGDVYAALRAEGIGVNVHYIPVHLHPFYRRRFGCKRGDCPISEAAYERIISLPIFPAMSQEDVDGVIAAVRRVTGRESDRLM